MTWRTLRIATILIIIQSLLFFPAPVSRAQDHPTQAHAILAQAASDLFLKRLDETGDFSRLIDEMYAEDFVERYLRQQMLEGEESGSSSVIYFAPGLGCKRDLLKLATTEDWRRLYIATNNFIYHVLITGLNGHADDLLNGRELDDETLGRLVPPNVVALFGKQPVLKYFLEIETDKNDKPGVSEPAEGTTGDAIKEKIEAKAIETPEEMRIAAETLQEGLRLLLEEQGNHSPGLTESGKGALAVIRQQQGELMKPTIGISDKELLGLPPGTRVLNVPTPFMLWLAIAEIIGKPQVVWAQFLVPSC